MRSLVVCNAGVRACGHVPPQVGGALVARQHLGGRGGGSGTGGLSVPMFIALRRFTLLCTLLLEFLMFRRVHERTTYAAVAVMIAGAPLLCRRSWLLDRLR